MDSQSTPRSSVSSTSPARRDLRSLVRPPPRTPAPPPSGYGVHAPPTGVGSARHAGPSPLVSSGSGGSRSSTRRESPVPCLDADQRVQADALLQLVTMIDLHSTGLRLFSGANVALYSANRFHTELGPDPNNLDNAVGHVFFRMDEKLTALAYPCRRFSFNLLNCLTPAACVKGISFSGGSMASVALIRGNQIIVGSVGDSRCVLSRNSQGYPIQGTVDFVHQKLASGPTDLRTICEGLLRHCFRSRDNASVILVQFKVASRIPLAPLASAVPVVNPIATGTSNSSAANPDAM